MVLAVLPEPPVERVPSLLRLRLRHGRSTDIPRGDQLRLAERADAGDWDAFCSPLHALLVHQGGRCALWHPAKPARDACAWGDERLQLYLDHDHGTGLARALLCPPCNSREGKDTGGVITRRLLADLRRNPPASRCPATAGLTYAWLTGWPQPHGTRVPRTANRCGPRPRPRPRTFPPEPCPPYPTDRRTS